MLISTRIFSDINSSLLKSKIIQRKSASSYILSFRKVDSNSESGIHFCSGVLITEENVLSTGRCLKRASLIIYPLYDNVFVLTGEENIWSPRTKALIKHMVVHQNYSEWRNFDNDIAVVTVSYICIKITNFNTFNILNPKSCQLQFLNSDIIIIIIIIFDLCYFLIKCIVKVDEP